MSSIQQQLVDAIIERLKLVKLANGYSTDVQDRNTFVWMPLELQATRLPSINLRDTSSTWEYPSDRLYYRNQSFEIVGMVTTTDSETHDAVRRLQSDLIIALYNEGDRTWGGLAEDTLITSSEIIVVQADKPVAGVRLVFETTFYHCQGDDAIRG